MPRKSHPTIPPPDALLCERCGYDLAGLRRMDDCPECGRAVRMSLPRELAESRLKCRRPAYALAAALVLAHHPIDGWGQAIPDRVIGGWLRFNLLVFVSCSLVLSFGLAEWEGLVRGVSLTTILASGFVLFVLANLIFQALCSVESLGIRFFGKRNGWRVTKDVAATVVGHASFAWILSAIGVGIVWGLFTNGTLHQSNLLGPISTYALAMFLAFLPGLLWFEALVWIGVRKLRFANIPSSERHLADSGVDARDPADR